MSEHREHEPPDPVTPPQQPPPRPGDARRSVTPPGAFFNPPSFGHRRYVVASRYPYSMVAFGQPTTLEQALAEADEQRPDGDVLRKVGVFELRLVKP